MMQPLPIGGFRWVEFETEGSEGGKLLDKAEEEWYKYKDKIFNSDDLGGIDYPKKGYLIECNIDYPDELHNLHDDLPFLPERMKPNKRELSEVQQDYMREMKVKQTEKLITTLHDKKNYVLTHEHLFLALQHGLIPTKNYKILEFDQKPWLSTYIEKNTEERKYAKNDFEKDFYKLMNNSVFGKTMEDVRNYQDIHVVTGEEEVLKLSKKATFQSIDILDKDLALVRMRKTTVTLNKPIYCGIKILDVSKVHMYQFLYDYIKPKYPNKNSSLLYMDTDSFF